MFLLYAHQSMNNFYHIIHLEDSEENILHMPMSGHLRLCIAFLVCGYFWKFNIFESFEY